jgi:hypothetical protein
MPPPLPSVDGQEDNISTRGDATSGSARALTCVILNLTVFFGIGR